MSPPYKYYVIDHKQKSIQAKGNQSWINIAHNMQTKEKIIYTQNKGKQKKKEKMKGKNKRFKI